MIGIDLSPASDAFENVDVARTVCWEPSSFPDSFGLPTCALSWTCHDCGLIRPEANISALFQGSMASAVLMHFCLNTTTGQRDQPVSSVCGHLVPKTPGAIFRGGPHSTIAVQLIPSLFDDLTKNTQDNGFVVDRQYHETGHAIARTSQFFFFNGVGIVFQLSLADTFVKVDRRQKIGIQQFLADVSSSVTGLLGIFGIILVTSELTRRHIRRKRRLSVPTELELQTAETPQTIIGDQENESRGQV
mmetsp:Transcript_58843/g.127944  ORF Transcript_58843/g.127944 Transcript_58843/m.127944 type:complete len:246 (-) Transcript_58843:60-797(-)